jgi:small subunit ribosomal protein S21
MNNEDFTGNDRSSYQNQQSASQSGSAQSSNSNPPPTLNQNEVGKERAGAMEVQVDHNLEKALKLLKRKLIKEGIFRELKARRYYEKPSERKKRKLKESMKKIRKDQARSRKNSGLLV